MAKSPQNNPAAPGPQCLVEASAGTGKTRAILDRAAALVKSDAALGMSQLVAITFTEKAAAELKYKLRQRLEKDSRDESISPSERANLQKALAGFDQAEIATIHSFCARLLRLRPVEAELSPAFEVIDSAGRDFLFDRVWDDWLEDNLVARPEFFSRLRLMGLPVGGIKDLARQLFADRDLLPAKPGWALPAKPVTLDAATKRFRELFEKCMKEVAGSRVTVLPRFMEEMKAVIDSNPKNIQRVWYQKDYGEIDGPEWKSCPAAAAIRDELIELFKNLRNQLFAKMIDELSGFLARLEQEKKSREVLDFQDLLLKSRDLVKNNRDAREYFKRRFKYILVDEFQDTDPLQVELVFFLAEQKDQFEKNWRKVKLEPGKLFPVGDPKQSIYRFRRADLRIYDQAREALAESGSGPIGALKHNFRSHPGLLEWVNISMEGRFLKRTGYQPAYSELEPGGKLPELEPPLDQPVVLLELETADPAQKKVEFIREAEANAIADFIAAQCGKLSIWHKEGDQIKSRPANFSDFAVLFPTHDSATLLKETMRTRNLPFADEASKEFLSRDEISGLRSVLAVLANPADAASLVGALRSLFLAVSDRELFEYKKDRGTWDWLGSRPDPKTHPALSRAFEFLRELYGQREQQSLCALIERLIERAGIRRLSRLHPRFSQALLNLERIKAFARTFDAEPGSGLFDFIRRLEMLEDSGDGAWPELVAEKANNAVHLMTMHKSKGLEFPVVILLNLCGSLSSKGRPLLKDWDKNELALSLGDYSTLNYDRLAEEEKEFSACEKIREFYVAVTRAKQYLVLPDHRKIDPKMNNRYISLLADGLPEDGDDQHLAAKLVKRVRAADLAGAAKPETVSRLEHFSQMKPADTGIEKEMAAFTKATEKLLADAAQFKPVKTPSGEERFEDWEGESELSRAKAKSVGILVHKIIELSWGQKLEFALKLAERLAQERGMESDLAELRGLVSKFWTSDFKKEMDAAESWPELPFVFEDGQSLWRGQIDILYRDARGVHIVDLKTDRVKPGEMDARAATYAEQMQKYSIAVKNLKGAKLTDASIFFLSPGVRKKV